MQLGALTLFAAALADDSQVFNYPLKNGGLEIRAAGDPVNINMEAQPPIPAFLFPITVGKEQNSYNLMVDTYIRSSYLKTSAYQKSSTAVNTTQSYREFNKAIVDYTNGFWFTDTWTVAGTTMNMRFGVGDSAKQYTNFQAFDGVLSLWPTPYTSNTQDTSLLNAMKRAKVINTRVFGLWMGTDDVGSITFGGLDRTKFSGPLYKFPLYESQKGTGSDGVSFSVRRFYAYDDKLGGALLQEGMTRCTIATGSINGGMPAGISGALANLYNATTASKVPAALQAGYASWVTVIQYQGEGGIALDVGAVVLKFPLKYILMDQNDNRLQGDAVIGNYYRISYDSPQCIFGQNYFAREYYAVFDFDNMEIAVAPANHDESATATSQLQSVGPTGVASAISAPAFSDTASSPAFVYSPTAWTSDYVFR